MSCKPFVANLHYTLPEFRLAGPMDRITQNLENKSVEKFSSALHRLMFALKEKQNAVPTGSPANEGRYGMEAFTRNMLHSQLIEVALYFLQVIMIAAGIVGLGLVSRQLIKRLKRRNRTCDFLPSYSMFGNGS